MHIRAQYKRLRHKEGTEDGVFFLFFCFFFVFCFFVVVVFVCLFFVVCFVCLFFSALCLLSNLCFKI